MKVKREILYLTADQVDKSVRSLYEKSGCVILSEVRNGTGYARSVRTADMLAVSTWPSRGLFAEGIEIKISRSDLARELENPAKADEIAKYCRKWWIACPIGLTEDQLIPDAWGVIEVDDKLKARISRQAACLDPIPMDTLFVCAVLRNFAETHIPMSSIDERLRLIQQQTRETVTKEIENHRHYRDSAALQAVSSFKEATGIDLLDDRGRHPAWDMGRIGESIDLLRKLRLMPAEGLKAAREALARASESVESVELIVSTWLKAEAQKGETP